MIEIRNENGRVMFEIEADFCHIFSLFVWGDRRRGHGKRLLHSAIEAIRDSGWNGEIQIVAESLDQKAMTTKQLISWYTNEGLIVYDSYNDLEYNR